MKINLEQTKSYMRMHTTNNLTHRKTSYEKGRDAFQYKPLQKGFSSDDSVFTPRYMYGRINTDENDSCHKKIKHSYHSNLQKYKPGFDESNADKKWTDYSTYHNDRYLHCFESRDCYSEGDKYMLQNATIKNLNNLDQSNFDSSNAFIRPVDISFMDQSRNCSRLACDTSQFNCTAFINNYDTSSIIKNKARCHAISALLKHNDEECLQSVHFESNNSDNNIAMYHNQQIYSNQRYNCETVMLPKNESIAIKTYESHKTNIRNINYQGRKQNMENSLKLDLGTYNKMESLSDGHIYNQNDYRVNDSDTSYPYSRNRRVLSAHAQRKMLGNNIKPLSYKNRRAQQSINMTQNFDIINRTKRNKMTKPLENIERNESLLFYRYNPEMYIAKKQNILNDSSIDARESSTYDCQYKSNISADGLIGYGPYQRKRNITNFENGFFNHMTRESDFVTTESYIEEVNNVETEETQAIPLHLNTYCHENYLDSEKILKIGFDNHVPNNPVFINVRSKLLLNASKVFCSTLEIETCTIDEIFDFLPIALLSGFYYLKKYIRAVGNCVSSVDAFVQTFVVCCLIGSKYYQDDYVVNNEIAQRANLSHKAILDLETHILIVLQYDLTIEKKEFIDIFDGLKPIPIQSTRMAKQTAEKDLRLSSPLLNY